MSIYSVLAKMMGFDGSGYIPISVSGQGNLQVDVLSGAGEAPQPDLDHGANSSIVTSAVQMTTTSTPAGSGVLVKAVNANTDVVYVGNSDVTVIAADATDGFELGAGEGVVLPVDNANLIYVIAASGTQRVTWLVV